MITRSPISPATTPPIIFIYIRLISILDPAESCAAIRTWQCLYRIESEERTKMGDSERLNGEFLVSSFSLLYDS